MNLAKFHAAIHLITTEFHNYKIEEMLLQLQSALKTSVSSQAGPDWITTIQAATMISDKKSIRSHHQKQHGIFCAF